MTRRTRSTKSRTSPLRNRLAQACKTIRLLCIRISQIDCKSSLDTLARLCTTWIGKIQESVGFTPSMAATLREHADEIASDVALHYLDRPKGTNFYYFLTKFLVTWARRNFPESSGGANCFLIDEIVATGARA